MLLYGLKSNDHHRLQLAMPMTTGDLVETARRWVWGGSPLSLLCDISMAALLRSLADFSLKGEVAPRRSVFILGEDDGCDDQWRRQGLTPFVMNWTISGMRHLGEGRFKWLLFVSEVYTMVSDFDEDDVFFLATSSADLVEDARLSARDLPPAIGWLMGYESHDEDAEGQRPLIISPTGAFGGRGGRMDGWTSGCSVFLASLQLLRVLFATTMQLPYHLSQDEIVNHLVYSGVIGRRGESITDCELECTESVPIDRDLVDAVLCVDDDLHPWRPPSFPLETGCVELHSVSLEGEPKLSRLRGADIVFCSDWALVGDELFAGSCSALEQSDAPGAGP